VGLRDLRGHEDERRVRALLGDVDAARLLCLEDAGELLAAAAVERDGDDIVLRRLVELGPGGAEALVGALVEVGTGEAVVAAPGADVDLYRRLGFEADGYRLVRPLRPEPAPEGAADALTLEELSTAIRDSWGLDTSDDPEEWTEENPARGQCAVTSLLVRDLLGGEILIAGVIRDGRRVERHAWNRLPSGLALDLTRSQFRAGETFEQPSVGEPTQSDPERMRLLSARVRSRLGI